MIAPALFVPLLFAVQAQTTSPAPLGPTYRFGDYDRDGLADVYIVRSAAPDRLYRNLGDGTFVDVTGASGLGEVTGTRLALWQDFDGDGALDLYVSAISGRSRLLRNSEAGSFVDVTLAAGVAHRDGEELFAQWIDLDLDGRPDLHVTTSSGDRLYRNLGQGRFELAALPTQSDLESPVVALALPQTAAAPGASSPGAPQALTSATLSGVTPAGSLPLAGGPTLICAGTLVDQTTNLCIEADSTPTLGSLYPLSTNLNVSSTGNVGIGTTTPAQKLDVAGAARATQFVSTVTTGQPLLVSSNAKVNNLNADLLDGLNSTVFSQLGQTIEGSEISDGTISNADLAQQAVDTVNLVPGAVDSSAIADGTIQGADIDQQAINAVHLAAAAVQGGNIAAGVVANVHLAPNAVTSGQIADGSVALADLASNSVDSSKIVDGSVDVADLAGNSVTSGKIANATIQDLDLAANCVTSPKIAAGAVSMSKLDTTGALAGQVLAFNGAAAQWSDVEPTEWTPITSVPFVITQPGGYYLTQNMVMSTAANGITIGSDDVVIDLNGFTLDGATVGIEGITDSAGGAARNSIVIRNGVVARFSAGGIYLPNTRGAQVENVRSYSHFFEGALIESGSFSDSYAIACGTGFQVTLAGSMTDCVVENMGSYGFRGVAATVSGCVARGCDVGFYFYESRIETSLATDCRVGFRTERSTAIDSQAIRPEYGFDLRLTSVALRCAANEASIYGFYALDRARVDACSTHACNVGFYAVASSSSLVIRCSSGADVTNYDIGLGNVAGPIVNATNIGTNLSPHANYVH